LKRYKQKSVKVGVFRRGSVTFGEKWKGTIPSNLHWSGKTRDVPVLYGAEILTDDYLILSQ